MRPPAFGFRKFKLCRICLRQQVYQGVIPGLKKSFLVVERKEEIWKLVTGQILLCPFCYIGASRMKRAMAAVGLNPEDLTMKAYQLNPNAPLETSETMLTEFAASLGMTTEQAKAQFAHMESVGNEEGLRIDMAGDYPNQHLFSSPSY